MEGLYVVIGLAMLYSTGHFLVLQFGKAYKDRTTYEKVVTIAAIVFIGLVYLDLMTG